MILSRLVVPLAPRPGSLGVSVALKVLLITQVNPVFRDPAATRDVVHEHAVLWAFGNGVVVIAVAVAILLIQRAARPGVTPGGRPSAERARPS